MAKSKVPAAPVAASPAPVVLYVAVGPKRGLTGTGHGRYSNEATWSVLAALPGASTTGLSLAAYAEAAAARNHKRFVSYAVKYGWLQKAPVAGSTLAVGPV